MKHAHPFMTWGPERQRQWLVYLGAGLLGFFCVLWLCGPDAEESTALEAEVAQWQARLPQVPMPKAVSDPTIPTSAASGRTHSPPWPGPHQTVSLWPWLQQRARAQGLQVLALRPQSSDMSKLATPGASGPALPEQTVLLQLQGRWKDWLALSRDLVEHASWWLVTHWLVVPADAGEVRIELQARVGLWPTVLHGPGGALWTGPEWPAAPVAPEEAALFGLPQAKGSAKTHEGDPAPATPLPLSPDPRQWPVHGLQLQGVWEQSGQWHAVFGAGLSQTTVRAGQQLGQERYRVHKVGMDGVVLRAPANGAVLQLGWQGDKP